MKVVQSLSFQHEVEGRVYSLVFPMPAPLGECYAVAATVCNEFLKKIKEEEEKAKENNLDEVKAEEAVEQEDGE